ncbi:ABC-type multidrug transport system, permease component [Hahella chejuensis KCTC 2396]|uniref:ABC-type multidrug transport system, permease component n=1 Tax=Hahella chejuensis (strain KCTC 2396) TaxID=349521 RepID=Q2SQC4_HAHCH|nr:ABC transporter permease [Hahella chejuensis]ABC27150.1 ABC-type multidrug transport system, permease component [Hahella chejuensis KCTC 2396]
MVTLLSPIRLWAVVAKEFIQLRRDRLTFAMIIGIPLIQLALFGFAINSDPKELPMAVRSAESSAYTRSIIQAIVNTRYFNVTEITDSEQTANEILARGAAQFVINIPADFTRRLLRGERPSLLLEADATDPAATSNALAAIKQIPNTALAHDLNGPLASLQSNGAPFSIDIHRRYNPEGITQYNIVPGLMGVILTMTMIMMTSLAITREHERGTMENLLAMPVQPLEVMVGKITPYILIGYIQVLVILAAALWVFHVPMLGSALLLMLGVLLFILANLTVGITISSIARNQAQAMQMSFFFFMPSILLSGFMFPFRGMPQWAQIIGEALPLTHFLRFIRGLLLKGNEWTTAWEHLWPLLAFTAVMMAVGLRQYRRTLD